MASLGEFGAALAADDADPDTFTFFGVELRARRNVGVIPIMRFADALDTATNDWEGMAAQRRLLKDLIVTEDFPQFESLALEHAANSDTILALSRALISGASGRPTGPPSDSAGGPSETTASSKDDSPLRIPPGFEDMASVDDLINQRVSSG